MHYQLYDGEDEFEPRAIPKPITKHDVSCKPFCQIVKYLPC